MEHSGGHLSTYFNKFILLKTNYMASLSTLTSEREYKRIIDLVLDDLETKDSTSMSGDLYYFGCQHHACF